MLGEALRLQFPGEYASAVHVEVGFIRMNEQLLQEPPKVRRAADEKLNFCFVFCAVSAFG